ncbi:MAG: hypothetical protein KDA05_01770 [Phycisphaerales bacterium]|nr:hypothetical protein [Phycisphaerales bacterium]
MDTRTHRTSLTSLALAAALAGGATCSAQEFIQDFEGVSVNTQASQIRQMNSFGVANVSVVAGLSRNGEGYPWPTPFAGLVGDQCLVAEANQGPVVIEVTPPAPSVDRFRTDCSLLWDPFFVGTIQVEIVALTLTSIEPVQITTIRTDPLGAFVDSRLLSGGQVVKGTQFAIEPGEWFDAMGDHGPQMRECYHSTNGTVWYTSLGQPQQFEAMRISINPAPGAQGFVAIDNIAVLQGQQLCLADLTTTAIAGSAGYGDPNGVLDNQDFFFYIAEFAAGNLLRCDLTTSAIPGTPGYGVADGVLSNEDFFYYLNQFAQGC